MNSEIKYPYQVTTQIKQVDSLAYKNIARGFQISFLSKQKQHTFQMSFHFFGLPNRQLYFCFLSSEENWNCFYVWPASSLLTKSKCCFVIFAPLTNGCIYPRLPSNTFICSHSSFPQIDFFYFFRSCWEKTVQVQKHWKSHHQVFLWSVNPLSFVSTTKGTIVITIELNYSVPN